MLNQIQLREKNREWPKPQGMVNTAGNPILPYIPNLTAREQRDKMNGIVDDPQY